MDISSPINTQNLFAARDSVVVITGGATGIGLAMASICVQTGARKVYILGRRQNALAEAAKALNQSSQVVVPIVCDVVSSESVSSAADAIMKDSGHIDVLINNAGRGDVPQNISSATTIEETSDILARASEAASDVLRTNTASVINVSAAFLPLLHQGNVKRGWPDHKLPLDDPTRMNAPASGDLRSSQIITVSSIASFQRTGITGIAYAASKAGATHIGKILATMLVPWNIRSNVIAPGLYPSEITNVLTTDQINYVSMPAGRAGNMADVAGALLYLIGNAGAYLNGSVLLTDGGRLTIDPASY
ncbi:hypothetical protein PpBr36_04250 [Pyricularia pennisetigena]|uniref:hypothetical protein n=1 Tax=Pyricularia pennisetigena TaxID=1578925 RepID=UPI00114D7E0B|nr:hypothetical protein PpBr36_04250 [Pyricularia pennisetigena]TLS26688.1 hypothetical protein PpBr36_04250 [Pyricularia pennisetigena]